jgi:hypothetical protein
LLDTATRYGRISSINTTLSGLLAPSFKSHSA